MSDTAAAPPPAKSTASDTVTVACKLPNGLVLRLFAMEPFAEPLFGGGMREGRRARRLPEEHVLNGASINLGNAQRGRFPEHAITGGYALTPGIPREFWDKWLVDNGASALVRNGLVFAHKSDHQARDMAKEREKVRTGLEPIDPDDPGARNPDFRRVKRMERVDADNL